MTTDATSTPTLDDIFDALQKAAEAAAASGGTLYGAQAKKQLTHQFPDFTERLFGFKKFIELLRAGNDAGRFRLEIIDGHPRITRPSMSPVGAQSGAVQGRLRADVWSTFITWDTGKRYWDRRRRRAIFIPTDDEGIPSWERSPSDFVEIDPISMQEQLGWMGSFAATQSEPVREKLQAALKDPRPGAFKDELDEHGLSGAWRALLQRRVMEHSAGWAERNEIPLTSIVEKRDRAHAKVLTTPKPESVTAPSTDVEQLRSRLRQIISDMSLAELSALPIPAAYLLER
ncbi:hypothetical protein J2W14_003029 [Pseudarthrobacter oxydans]|uniref:OST-HTH/LOTUS domain-containing protein n=1 Tax=Pseudarthrobacter oxydans TaxID=1671 RepID=UPI002787FB31|nr:OST-HTH/LOTUS domain-containing protein [Pseudarthrobacter oxydans]MDP9983608.1 hypothetical protein [Pseudarthrobacter oxydans]